MRSPVSRRVQHVTGPTPILSGPLAVRVPAGCRRGCRRGVGGVPVTPAGCSRPPLERDPLWAAEDRKLKGRWVPLAVRADRGRSDSCRWRLVMLSRTGVVTGSRHCHAVFVSACQVTGRHRVMERLARSLSEHDTQSPHTGARPFSSTLLSDRPSPFPSSLFVSTSPQRMEIYC